MNTDNDIGQVEAVDGRSYVHRWFAIDRGIKANQKIMFRLNGVEVKVWLYLMAHTDNQGNLPRLEYLRWPLFPECTYEQLLATIERFKSEDLRLIDDLDGVLQMHDFEDYQPVGNRTKSGRRREDAAKVAARQRKHRFIKAQALSGTTGVNKDEIHQEKVLSNVSVTQPVTTDVTSLEEKRTEEKTTTTHLPPSLAAPGLDQWGVRVKPIVRPLGEESFPNMTPEWQERWEWLEENYPDPSRGTPQGNFQAFHDLIGLPAPKTAALMAGKGFQDVGYFDSHVKPAVLAARDSDKYSNSINGRKPIDSIANFLRKGLWLTKWTPSHEKQVESRIEAAMPIYRPNNGISTDHLYKRRRSA